MIALLWLLFGCVQHELYEDRSEDLPACDTGDTGDTAQG